jgi:hypothetical protein
VGVLLFPKWIRRRSQSGPVVFRQGAGPDDPRSGPAAFFIHGLAGTPVQTWGRMITLCAADLAFNAHTLDCFTYPTRLIPLLRRTAKVQDIARGLSTELKLRHGHRTDITLVCHSLGGIIARQYIVNEFKTGRRPLVSRLMLYAVPNTGAALATIGSRLSWYNGHLHQLCEQADILELLNEDWVRLDIENQLPVQYVVAGDDGLVSPLSARPFIGKDNTSTLIGYNHRSIVEPENERDDRYTVLQQFVHGASLGGITAQRGLPLAQTPDCLFDIYTVADEPYYLRREYDVMLAKVLESHHAWILGPTGVGKSAALRRAGLLSSRRFIQLTLGGHTPDALSLFEAMSVELSDLLDIHTPDVGVDDSAGTITRFRRLLRSAAAFRPLIILVEEIPIPPGPELSKFLHHLLQLLLSIAADPSTHGRIIFAFSSLSDPTLSLTDGMGKFREHVQLLKMGLWATPDTRQLVDLIATAIKPHLSDADRSSIAQGARGLPRFVKMVFRRWHNNSADGVPLPQLLDEISTELI